MAITAATTADSKNNEHPPLFTPAFVLGWLVNFSQYLCFYFLVTVMALYAMQQFAVSEAAGGFAASAFVVGATVARLFAGWASDRFGKKQILLIFVGISTIASLLYIPVNSFGAFIAVRLIHGFSYSMASTAVMALVQTVIPAGRRAEGTGYFALGSTLATAVGPAVALFVVGSFSYDALFWLTLATNLIGLVLTIFFKKPAHLREADRNRPKVAWTPKSVIQPAVITIGFFMLMIGLSYAGIITYINGFAQERGLSAGAGLFFIAYAVAMLAMRSFLGRVQDKRGANPVMFFGLANFAIALAIMAVAGENWHIVIAGIFTGLGYGTLMPAAQAVAVSSVPAHQVGSGISTLFLFTDIGIGLGPILLGVLVSATGYSVMYGCLAVLIVFASVYYWLTHKH
ncbi:MFS transporter [Corynebacterium callunae]|uniref:MFS transporter n=1 Tax=Corynebacterium callunae TaxID=1721 RepID=UPI003981E653